MALEPFDPGFLANPQPAHIRLRERTRSIGRGHEAPTRISNVLVRGLRHLPIALEAA